MAAPVGFDGRAGHFRWPIYTTVSMAAPVIFDGRAGRFRWPRRSFSMAAPVGFDGRAGRQLCPYEAQYHCDLTSSAICEKSSSATPYESMNKFRLSYDANVQNQSQLYQLNIPIICYSHFKSQFNVFEWDCHLLACTLNKHSGNS